MAKLSAKERKALKTSSFALPATREYPIQDRDHAKAALSLEHNASPQQQAVINRAIDKKYPGLRSK